MGSSWVSRKEGGGVVLEKEGSYGVQDPLNYNFPQRRLGMKLIFYMWLYIHKSNKFINTLSTTAQKDQTHSNN